MVWVRGQDRGNWEEKRSVEDCRFSSSGKRNLQYLLEEYLREEGKWVLVVWW